MFRFFEGLVNPFPPVHPKQPPQSIYAFCRHYTKGIEPYLVLMAILTATVATTFACTTIRADFSTLAAFVLLPPLGGRGRVSSRAQPWTMSSSNASKTICNGLEGTQRGSQSASPYSWDISVFCLRDAHSPNVELRGGFIPWHTRSRRRVNE